MKSIEEYISPSEAARVLGISYKMVWWLYKAGKLQAVSTRSGILLDPDLVEQFRLEREANPPRRGRKKASHVK
jgi:excisionase family DNA binding protein